MKTEKTAPETINIKIVGTMQDVRLLKRIMKLYLPVASKSEQEHIECYISLINHAVLKATAEAKV